MQRAEADGPPTDDVGLVADVRESIVSDDDEPTTDRCVDCHATFDERKQCGPECGEWFEAA